MTPALVCICNPCGGLANREYKFIGMVVKTEKWLKLRLYMGKKGVFHIMILLDWLGRGAPIK